MVSNFTLGIVGIINLFLIPMIGLKTYCRRHEMEWRPTWELGYRYILFVVLNLPLTRVLASFAEKLALISITIETSKYTLIALVSVFMLVYIMESVEKYLQVRVSVDFREAKAKRRRGKRRRRTKKQGE